MYSHGQHPSMQPSVAGLKRCKHWSFSIFGRCDRKAFVRCNCMTICCLTETRVLQVQESNQPAAYSIGTPSASEVGAAAGTTDMVHDPGLGQSVCRDEVLGAHQSGGQVWPRRPLKACQAPDPRRQRSRLPSPLQFPKNNLPLRPTQGRAGQGRAKHPNKHSGAASLQSSCTGRLYPPSPSCRDAPPSTSVGASSAHANGQRRSRQFRV